MDRPPRSYEQVNPYAAPLTQGGPEVDSDYDLEKLRASHSFRIVAIFLGIAWLLLAALLFALAAMVGFTELGMMIGPETALAIFAVSAVTGFGWAIAGIGTLCRQRWGIYIGLSISYLAVFANLAVGNICGIIVLAFILILAHFTLHQANRMRGAVYS